MTIRLHMELAAALAERDASLAAIGGCGDGGCVVSRPKGQRTNGGCRCLTKWDDDAHVRARKVAAVNNRFADEIRRILECPASST